MTISLFCAPVSATVPLVVPAELWAATVEAVKAAVPYEAFVMLGPVAPISNVPTVAVVVTDIPPVFVIVPMVAVFTLIVPSVFVPVEAVMVEPNVTAPSWSGIVAVLMEAVEMVAVESVTEGMVAVLMEAVPTERVPMVAVPVDAVRLVPKVTMPERRLVPSTAKEPVLCTPVVERFKADEVLSPSVIT